MTTYRQAGVDIKAGDICSRIMSAAADATFKNKESSIKILESSGLHRVITVSAGSFSLMLNSDGIGTKVEFAERTGCHSTMAFDLFAMLCDDSVRFGAEPVAVSNILDMNSLDVEVVEQLAAGMKKAAKKAGVAVLSGEIAELGNRVAGYGKMNYNWAGTVLSIMKHPVRWDTIKKGDFIVGFREKGFRSNGISLVRKILEKNYGDKWHLHKPGSKNLGEMALEPSTIYTKAVLSVMHKAKGIAHITGGGIPGKLGRITGLKGYGADIEDPFKPCELMLLCQKEGKVADKEAYRVWNMGQGMLIITESPEEIISAAKKQGTEVKVVGTVTHNKGITVKSAGVFRKGEKLVY